MISQTSLSVLRGYSNPFEPFDEDLGRAWMVRDVIGRCAVYFDAVRGRADLDAGLVNVLESAPLYIAAFDDVWYPSFGALRSVPEASEPAAKHLVELAMRLHEAGAPGDWTAATPEGSRFVFDRWVLPACHQIRVSAGSGRVNLQGRGPSGLFERAWVREFGEWRDSNDTPADAQDVGEGIRVIPWPLRKDADEQDRGQFLPDFGYRCHEALLQLQTASPRYAAWVRRVTRVVMPLEPLHDHISSWSSRDYPSLLAMDGNGYVTDVSETFVHESSHQHCTLLQRFGRLFYPGPMPEAWSPVKKQVRPMYKILVSFHAFGNIVLFFRALRDTGRVDDKWYATNARRYVDWVSELGETLNRCEALTPVGDCMWRPLAERVAME